MLVSEKHNQPSHGSLDFFFLISSMKSLNNFSHNYYYPVTSRYTFPSHKVFCCSRQHSETLVDKSVFIGRNCRTQAKYNTSRSGGLMKAESSCRGCIIIFFFFKGTFDPCVTNSTTHCVMKHVQLITSR